MRKFNTRIVFVLVISLLIIGYTFYRSPKEPPKIVIAIGNENLDYVVGKNQWQGAKYDGEDECEYAFIIKTDGN